MSTLTSAQITKQEIAELLDDLPMKSLVVVEQFVRFLHEQMRQGQLVVTTSNASITEDKASHPFRYPTVSLPHSVLDGLVGIMPPVGGDALVDTEALYDKV
jgi:hypothetical protein